MLGSVGVFIVLKLLDYSIFTSLSMGGVIGLAVVGVSKKALVSLSKRAECNKVISHRLQYVEGSFQKVIQDFKLVHNSGLKSSTSFCELQDSLTLLSSDSCLHINLSFKSAFGSLQSEIKKARGSIQPCYEELHKGIVVTKIDSF